MPDTLTPLEIGVPVEFALLNEIEFIFFLNVINLLTITAHSHLTIAKITLTKHYRYHICKARAIDCNICSTTHWPIIRRQARYRREFSGKDSNGCGLGGVIATRINHRKCDIVLPNWDS